LPDCLPLPDRPAFRRRRPYTSFLRSAVRPVGHARS
jgi:hypothetical protein